jgi:hypothetical protein
MKQWSLCSFVNGWNTKLNVPVVVLDATVPLDLQSLIKRLPGATCDELQMAHTSGRHYSISVSSSLRGSELSWTIIKYLTEAGWEPYWHGNTPMTEVYFKKCI